MTTPVPPETIPAPAFTPRRIYVASSWRNPMHPAFVERLRAEGHEVFDYRNPAPGNTGFAWRQIRPEPPPWSAEETLMVLSHEIATHSFSLDFGGMQQADTCVMLQPCGRSAALELGWSVGAGKHTVAVLVDGQEPELMLNMADELCVGEDAAIRVLRAPLPARFSRPSITPRRLFTRGDASAAVYYSKHGAWVARERASATGLEAVRDHYEEHARDLDVLNECASALVNAHDLLRRLVAEMARWGAEGDGVPEDCTAFTEAVALLNGGR